MNSKNTAVLFMLLLGGITVVIGLLAAGFKLDPNLTIAFCAFSISGIALLFSIAIPIDEARAGNIEKRLECFYKPTAQIIESKDNINNNPDKIIAKLQKIRQYDHLAKDETTKKLFRQLTGTLVGVSTAPTTKKR